MPEYDQPIGEAVREALIKQYPILKFFTYEHLPPAAQKYSKPFGDLAFKMAYELLNPQETAAGLRKLLEAKDCFVRASFK